jgi:endonuclease-3 related protein
MQQALKTIYVELFKAFGPQHWWPAKTPFETMLGAILTQNTNWKNVEKALSNLREKNLLDAARLIGVNSRTLAKCLQPSGYYNIKAKRVKNFLLYFKQKYSLDHRKMYAVDTAALRQELLAVNGIGPESADSILLYALEKPVFVVDAYTRRVLVRHGFIDENARYDQIQNLFMQNLESNVKLYNEYHALIVKLCKEFCSKNNPNCGLCPIAGLQK